MTSPVTSYPSSPGAGFAGMIGDEAPRYIGSAVLKEAAATPFGLMFKKGTNDDEVLLPTTSTDVLAGIGVHRHDVNTIGSTGWAAAAGIPAGDRFDIMRSGVVMVVVEEAVTQFDQAYYRYASGAGGTQKGAFRKSADTTTAAAIKGAHYLKSGGVGALVPLYFDIGAANG